MAGRIIYLEVDDEITSAAARIRDADADRLALVLPYGSRVATSRINFRLLSRDALTHDKRVSIVAGDAATRALAASAGLPVFATVAEYEIAVAQYYMNRGAYVAAAQRSKTVVDEFDGSPSVRQALEIMVICYEQMELKELAAQTRAMYRANYEGEIGEGKKAGGGKKKWYKLWLAS